MKSFITSGAWFYDLVLFVISRLTIICMRKRVCSFAYFIYKAVTYSKSSKILNIFLVLFSNKMLAMPLLHLPYDV